MYLEADIKSCFSREQEFSRNGTKLMITLDMSILTKFLLTLNFTRIVGLRYASNSVLSRLSSSLRYASQQFQI